MANIDQSSGQVTTKKENALVGTLVIVVIAVALLALIGFLFLKPKSQIVEGQAEATSVRISGKLPGRVMEFYVSEGQQVKAGDTLVHIHSSVADAKLYQAEAMKDAAAAQNKKIDAGTRKQVVQSAYDLWQQAIAAKNIAEKTYNRMESLFKQDVVSAQKRDEAYAAYTAAVSGESAAKSQYMMAKEGAQSEDKASSKALVDAAQGSVMEVEALLQDQYLMGKEIEIMIPALDKKKVKATVYYIRDMGTYAIWRSTKATGEWDSRTFQIKARPTEDLPDLRPGMSVIYDAPNK